MNKIIIIKQSSIESNEKSPIHVQQNITTTSYTIYSERGEIEIRYHTDKGIIEMRSVKEEMFNGVQKFELLHDAIKAAKKYLE